MLKKLAKFSPLALLGVTMSGNVITLETSDMLTLAWSVGEQMSGYLTNALLIIGVGLIVVFGFLIVNKLFAVTRVWGGKRRRRR